MQSSITEIFGENVFDDAVMQERLPKKVYAAAEADLSGEGERAGRWPWRMWSPMR